jgi:hypothetical protein
MTPRMAAVLWSVAQILAGHGYDDVGDHGSDLLPERTGWYLFARYPQLTWSQDAAWRRRAAREHPDDLDWDAMPDVLFQDTDILHLFEPGLDGIDDPHNALNAEMAIGDYRPSAWFETFANMQPRDERRGFRR